MSDEDISTQKFVDRVCEAVIGQQQQDDQSLRELAFKIETRHGHLRERLVEEVAAKVQIAKMLGIYEGRDKLPSWQEIRDQLNETL